VFGTVVFRAREHVDMPPPGDTRPARMDAELSDPIWDWLYAPLVTRHLALIELSASLKLVLCVSLLACLFAPWGIVAAGATPPALAVGIAAYIGKLAVGGSLLALFENSIAKMRVFRVPEFLGAALMLGLMATLLCFVSGSF
jgi:formate hydrogenlyase subunit 4